MGRYIVDVKTPALDQAESRKARFGLENHGLLHLNNVYWNLSREALYEEAIFRSEGSLSRMGPLVVATGDKTACALDDRFMVREIATENEIWWGQHNRPFSQPKFNAVWRRLEAFLQGRDMFVQDCHAGRDPELSLPVRVITETAHHSLFARNLFAATATIEEARSFVPEFTVVAAPSFRVEPQVDATESSTCILIDLSQKLCIIGGTGYAGEIRRAVYAVQNYLLPKASVLPMRCAANVGPNGDTALFFGLSGSGKATLSADPKRQLVGDDVHGWSDDGVFNLENGCHTRVLGLTREANPQAQAASERFGTLLENVVLDPVARTLDLGSRSVTPNTRAAYSLDQVDNAWSEALADHPKNIFILACDASGVLPPIARLTPEQATYYFLSGYSSTVTGDSPEARFSAGFGASFLALPPKRYADALRAKAKRHDVNCWLVNSGWVGGPFGVGNRISIEQTRALLDAALAGKLSDVEHIKDPVFGFEIPKSCDGVPPEILNPIDGWADREAFKNECLLLASLFIENFKRFAADCPAEVAQAGPAKRDF